MKNAPMPCFAGIDLGSSAIKAVLIDGDKSIMARLIHPTGLILDEAINAIRQDLEAQLGAHYRLAMAVSTGYGRHRVNFSQHAKPEIICHAKGVFHQLPQPATIIDIGGQDNKVIQMDAGGMVTNFRMNTKCAAGTGAFLEEIAAKAQISMSRLHQMALHSQQASPVNSFCTVFAMTEVLKKIMGGEKLEDIARGVYLSIVDRIREIYRSQDKALVLTGGVIENNPIMLGLLEEKLGKRPHIPERPQFAGALGAALFALELAQDNQKHPMTTAGQAQCKGVQP